jgi:glycosyltransferase involved in cell wall biosynthesis
VYLFSRPNSRFLERRSPPCRRARAVDYGWRPVAPPAYRVLQTFQPPDGGVPEHVLQVTRGLLARGRGMVVAGPPDAALRPRFEELGVPYFALELVGRVPAPLRDLSAARGLRRALRSEPCDLVHAHGQKAGLVARPVAARIGVPALYTPHSFVYRTQLLRPRRAAGLRYRANLAAERALGKRTAMVVACADDERAAAIEDGIATPDRVRTVNYGVGPDEGMEPDPQLVAFRGAGPLFGIVAGLRDQKGLPTLLDALELLAAERRAPRFAIVGNGPLRGEIERRVSGGPLAGTTLVTGFSGRVEPYLAALDAFVLPSYWEGMPIAVLEAMAMGLPVVASAVNGTPEAVADGETGYLVPAHDAHALAERLSALAGDGEARRRTGEAGRRVARERFTLERMVATLDELYLELLGRRPAGPAG